MFIIDRKSDDLKKKSVYFATKSQKIYRNIENSQISNKNWDDTTVIPCIGMQCIKTQVLGF